MNTQIEELASIMCRICASQNPCECSMCSSVIENAEAIFNANYRKASDVVREIFEELELKAPFFCENQVAYEHFKEELAKLKKKYESKVTDNDL